MPTDFKSYHLYNLNRRAKLTLNDFKIFKIQKLDLMKTHTWRNINGGKPSAVLSIVLNKSRKAENICKSKGEGNHTDVFHEVYLLGKAMKRYSLCFSYTGKDP